MSYIQTGNFSEANSKHNGWILGHFIENPLFKTGDFEIKWGKHKKNETKNTSGTNKSSKTLAILVRGKMLVVFPESNQKVILEKEGDYVFWPEKVSHSWVSLEDSLAITVRWPSVPNDQVTS